MPRLSQWYLRISFLDISLFGYLEWNCCSGIYGDWNSTTTPNHSIAPTQSISRVWHPPQFVRLNRILFHPGDSQLLLMLIISRSLTIYTSSPQWQQYIRSMNAEISETTEVQMAITQRPSPVNKTHEILRQHCRLNICRYIGWIEKCCIREFNQYVCQYWDGSAVYWWDE